MYLVTFLRWKQIQVIKMMSCNSRRGINKADNWRTYFECLIFVEFAPAKPLFTTHSIDRNMGIIDVCMDHSNKNGRIWTLCNVNGVYSIPSKIVLSIWNWMNFWNLKMQKSIKVTISQSMSICMSKCYTLVPHFWSDLNSKGIPT